MPGPGTIADYTVNTSSNPPPTGGTPAAAGSQRYSGFQPVGTAPITGTHNTILHVAAWGIFWLGVAILVRKNGARLVSVGPYGGR